jgi:hypothetical protein
MTNGMRWRGPTAVMAPVITSPGPSNCQGAFLIGDNQCTKLRWVVSRRIISTRITLPGGREAQTKSSSCSRSCSRCMWGGDLPIHAGYRRR